MGCGDLQIIYKFLQFLPKGTNPPVRGIAKRPPQDSQNEPKGEKSAAHLKIAQLFQARVQAVGAAGARAVIKVLPAIKA